MPSITVNVRLFGTLKDRASGSYDHEKGINVALDEGASIRDLLRGIGLSEKEAGFFVVNSVPRKLTDRLSNGDEVSVFLPLAGG